MIKNNILYNNSSPWLFNLKKAKGCFIWDENGNKMLDFTSGWNVSNLGWNHPEIVEAIISQAKINLYNPMETTDPMQQEYAKALTDSLPKGLDVAVRATGGTEANEEALKTARAFTKRKKIIGCINTYHGQSFGDMSIGYKPEYVEAIAPMVPGFIQIPFPDVYRTDKNSEDLLLTFEKNLENILRHEDVAAFITEAGIVTGWGSTVVAPDGYLTVARQLTKKYGTLLILDEVGTGFSRCGKLFGMELEGVTPDIATFAKGISNGGAAIGAMVTSEEISNEVSDKANLISTFGWTPIACAASLKALQIHIRDKVWERGEIHGRYIRETLQKELKNYPFLGNISGKGMEIGVDLVVDKTRKSKNVTLYAKVLQTAREKSLLLIGDGEGNFQFMPPLIMEKKLIDQGLEIFVKILKSAL